MYYEDLGIRICTKREVEESLPPLGETRQIIRQVEEFLKRAGVR